MKKSESKLKKTAVITALCCLLLSTSCGKTNNEITKKDPPVNPAASETSANISANTADSGTGLSESGSLNTTSEPTATASSADGSAAGGKSTKAQITTTSTQSANNANAGTTAAATTTTTAATTANDPLTKIPDITTAAETTASRSENTKSATSTEATTLLPDGGSKSDNDATMTLSENKVLDVLPLYELPADFDMLSLHILDDDYLSPGYPLMFYSGYYNMRTKIYNAPSRDAAELTTINAFSSVTAYTCVRPKNGAIWAYVEYNDTYGWIESYMLKDSSFTIPNSDRLSLPDNIYNIESACDYTEYYLLADSIGLYAGPSESSEELLMLNEGTGIYILGDNDPYSDWRFIVIETMREIQTYGWVRASDFYTLDEYSPLYYQKHGEEFVPLRISRGGGKPVLYLYPEKPTDVSVKLKLSGCEFYSTYPKYNNGWKVTAYPDGRLVNKADGCGYDYLFWDTKDRNSYTFSDGFCVKGEDTEKFLRKTLKQIGLSEREMNEFIVYWLPQMEHEPYNVIRFQSDEYEKTTKLTISPKPDSLLRVFMTYYSVDKPEYLIPQEFETFERKGFTAVEWGGEKLVGLW